ncbi:bifunctional helix-turn-helix transcriptional regulator/GNAT family N-acetyltransferase [Crossiella cryophila]|uniref:DNA-binding MarR family transcriptional regulator n=1 Tax=Crossiella cryophila TaxID=43355 RepID=A0A7W7CEQ2_9PSEU|nr:bifunctional helix-turn-helix transcriptional regulator/GNAT family N-acetyltransferase [Crossiella cryophila]MBB4679781.1 DNA-binding MarR family transcriptional regulator [Crossiella cryophila]
MDTGLIEQVRRFNRTVTQRLGALDEAYLARNRPLGQCRLLWEIGPDGREVRELRARLDLDSGYLSRMLRALGAEGLVEVGADPVDGRVRMARLTAAGLAERAELDRLSDELATSMLLPLNGSQRDRLSAAMAEVERLLAASMVEVAVVDPASPDARHCVDAYFADLAARFDNGFDPARSNPAEDAELTLPHGMLLVATLHGQPVGCGALKLRRPDWAEVKRMWVSPTVRGLGLGRRLLAELETRAAARGVRTLRLETNQALAEAIGLYLAAGYREVPAFNDEPYAHHWFAKTLAG